MENCNLMICMTCKTVKWVDSDLLHEYIEEHQAHHFTILTDNVREDMGEFRTWFLTFMGWPTEVEA